GDAGGGRGLVGGAPGAALALRVEHVPDVLAEEAGPARREPAAADAVCAALRPRAADRPLLGTLRRQPDDHGNGGAGASLAAGTVAGCLGGGSAGSAAARNSGGGLHLVAALRARLVALPPGRGTGCRLPGADGPLGPGPGGGRHAAPGADAARGPLS